MGKKTKISCVIPCYRSSRIIGKVVALLTETLQKRADTYDYEIILVNDSTPDGNQTIDELYHLQSQDPDHVVAVDLARNFGQFPAIMAGFQQVRGDIVVVLDDDMQCPPTEMWRLVDRLEADDLDIVYAYYPHREFAAWRNWGSAFNTWCARKFMRVPADLQINNYYAVRRFVVDNALRYKNPYPYIDGLLMQSVERYANVEITHHAREEGNSGYTLSSLIAQWFDGVTIFSEKPLRFAWFTGAVMLAVGLLVAIVTFIQNLIHPEIIAGWRVLLAAMMFLCGMVLFALGMMGEYVGRIYISINNMPQYVVRKVVDERGRAQTSVHTAENTEADAGAAED